MTARKNFATHIKLGVRYQRASSVGLERPTIWRVTEISDDHVWYRIEKAFNGNIIGMRLRLEKSDPAVKFDQWVQVAELAQAA